MTHLARAMAFLGPGQPLTLTRLPVPEPRGNEVLAKVIGCTLCGSDLHTYDGRRTVPTPSILGHEILGRVAAFGPTAARRDVAGEPLGVGDRITWSLVASCGDCFYCRRSLPQKCERGIKYGHEPLRPGAELRGGLAEYCLLAAGTAIVRLPETLPDAVAYPASCATATVAAIAEAAGPAEAVLILGAGMLGLTACAMARAWGAREVLCCDLDAGRRDRAQEFGATRVAAPEELAALVAAATDGRGVDAVLELSGAPAAFESAFPLVRMGGSLVLAGAVFPARPIPLGMEQIVRRNLTVCGVHNYAPRNLQSAVQFLARQTQYPFASLIGPWFPLDAADEAFRHARQSRALRVGIQTP